MGQGHTWYATQDTNTSSIIWAINILRGIHPLYEPPFGLRAPRGHICGRVIYGVTHKYKRANHESQKTEGSHKTRGGSYKEELVWCGIRRGGNMIYLSIDICGPFASERNSSLFKYYILTITSTISGNTCVKLASKISNKMSIAWGRSMAGATTGSTFGTGFGRIPVRIEKHGSNYVFHEFNFVCFATKIYTP